MPSNLPAVAQPSSIHPSSTRDQALLFIEPPGPTCGLWLGRFVKHIGTVARELAADGELVRASRHKYQPQATNLLKVDGEVYTCVGEVAPSKRLVALIDAVNITSFTYFIQRDI